MLNLIEIGNYIKTKRIEENLTQKDLALKLDVSPQAVSKWEGGLSAPDIGILLELSDVLNTSVDLILTGGKVLKDRSVIRVSEVIKGFDALLMVRDYFGHNSIFFKSMIEGINEKMNMDILEYLEDDRTKDVVYAEVLIQALLNDNKIYLMDDVKENIKSEKMIKVLEDYLKKIR